MSHSRITNTRAACEWGKQRADRKRARDKMSQSVFIICVVCGEHTEQKLYARERENGNEKSCVVEMNYERSEMNGIKIDGGWEHWGAMKV